MSEYAEGGVIDTSRSKKIKVNKYILIGGIGIAILLMISVGFDLYRAFTFDDSGASGYSPKTPAYYLTAAAFYFSVAVSTIINNISGNPFRTKIMVFVPVLVTLVAMQLVPNHAETRFPEWVKNRYGLEIAYPQTGLFDDMVLSDKDDKAYRLNFEDNKYFITRPDSSTEIPVLKK